MVIFRENSEDIYAGVEFEANTEKANKLIDILGKDLELRKFGLQITVGLELNLCHLKAAKG